MKFLLLLSSLFLSVSLNAQNKTQLNKVEYDSTNGSLSNNFILPPYTNSILDAEHYFSEYELSDINHLIDSVFFHCKLKIQFAFITQEYFENDSLKFDQYSESLRNKWNPGEDISRILLIICMQQSAAAIKFSGTNLNLSLTVFNKASKDSPDLSDVEKEEFEKFQTNATSVIGLSNLGSNLKSKNYNKAIKEFIQVITEKKEIFFHF